MPVWGSIILVVCAVGSLVVTITTLYHKGLLWLGEQLTQFRIDLTKHAETLVDHSKRMTTTEERYISLLQELRGALAEFRADLQGHARTLTEHQNRMSATEDRYFSLAQDFQRLIGRSEIDRMDRDERRTRPVRGDGRTP